MSSNILKAIINLINNPVLEIKNEYANKTNNRINNVGDALEEYVKDLFSGAFNEKNPQERLQKLSSTFSYLGNSSNPPDLILKNSDAIEIKKTESYLGAIALNSSYPKQKLYSNSTLISKDCRNCEDSPWTSKDMLYIVGVAKHGVLSDLCMVYGMDYAADYNIYENIIHKLKSGIIQTEGLEFSETKELGKLKKVDPLGITDLRIRGMWQIETPFKVFDYIYQKNRNKNFNLMAIINIDKYNSLPLQDRINIEMLSKDLANFNISTAVIQSPDNPAKLVPVKLFHFSI